MASVTKAPGGLGRAGAIPALSLADACLACSPKPLSLQIPRQAIPVLCCARINSDATSLLQLHPIPFSWQRGAQGRFVPSFSQLFMQPFLLQTKQTPPAVSPGLFLGWAVAVPRTGQAALCQCQELLPGAHAISRDQLQWNEFPAVLTEVQQPCSLHGHQLGPLGWGCSGISPADSGRALSQG